MFYFLIKISDFFLTFKMLHSSTAESMHESKILRNVKLFVFKYCFYIFVEIRYNRKVKDNIDV